MTTPVYIVDIMSQIVANVQTEILATIQNNETIAMGTPSLIQTINFQYGHKNELLANLKEIDQTPSLNQTKFPLIYLVMDFWERRGVRAGIYATLNLNLVIAHQTESTYKVPDRYNNVFKPVLYPIYYSLLNQIAQHPNVQQPNEELIEHTKYDRVYWGTQSMAANQLNDYVDAIEINNLAIDIYSLSCLTA